MPNTEEDKQANIPTEDSASVTADYEYFISSPFFAGFEDFNSVERKNFLKSFEALPQNLKTRIVATETASTIYSLKNKYNISDKQISQIASGLRRVMTGEIFANNLPRSLVEEVKIETSAAMNMAGEIANTVLKPVINELRQIQQQKFPDRITNQPKTSIDPIIASQKPDVINLRPAPSTSSEKLSPQPQTSPPPPRPPQPIPPQPKPSPQPSQAQPSLTPQPPKKEFKMPTWSPPSSGGQPPGSVLNRKDTEPKQNENTGRTLDLRELER